MRKRAQLLAPLVACALAVCLLVSGCSNTTDASAAKPAASSVVTTTMYSKKLGIDWNYDVYLPAGYDAKADTTYPVIYMMHGLYGNHRNLLERFNSQQMMDGVISRQGQKAIVVFIDGFNSFYINSKDGMQMEDAIMQDLVPTIEKTYKVSPKREDHAIGGISMGGYGAARLSLKYSDYFSKAILISPAVWSRLPEDSPFVKNLNAFNDGTTNWSWDVYDELFPTKYLKSDKPVSFYIETTADDTTVPVKDVDSFEKDLKDAGVDVTYQRDTGDNHNWTYWAKTAPKAYDWALDQFKN